MRAMRKWLVLLLVLAVLYILSKFNTKRAKARFPFLKRLDRTISVLAVVLLVVYVAAFVYWLLTR